MRRRFAMAALAALIGMAIGCDSASAARDQVYGYNERWYKAYERHREARDKWRAKREARAYERYMSNERYRSHNRYGYGSYGDRYYDRYYNDRHYRHGYYTHRYHRFRHYYTYGYYYRPYGNLDYSGSGFTEYSDRTRTQLNDHRWRPEDYPTGWKAWWTHIDREGRGGRQ